MSDSSGTGSASGDPRPRPQYGEYAPPGWKSPVPGEDAAATPAPAQAPAQPAPAPTAAPPGGEYDWGTPKPVKPAGRRRSADTVISFALLGLGLYFGVFGSFQAAIVDPAPQFLASLQQSGFDTAGVLPDFSRLMPILAGLAVGLWGAALAWTLRRVRARRIAFWVPLTAGVLFTLVQSIALLAVFMATPGAMEMLTSFATSQTAP